MFFILSKILSFLIKPTFWILLLIISSIIFKSKRKRLLYISLFVFWFFGNGYIVDVAYRMWEGDAISVSELEKPYSYGIVLGGFSGYNDKKDRIEFNDCGDRLFYAIQLYNKGIIKKSTNDKVIRRVNYSIVTIPLGLESLTTRPFQDTVL